MAFFRALETSQAPHKRLFQDPLAVRFLRPSLKLAFHIATIPVVGNGIRQFMDHRWPGARSSGTARTRLIDDLMLEAFERGLEQVVILGAGFDARPYRLPHPPKTRFFELDQPNTSRAKRSMIEGCLGTLPKDVAFIEVDFNRQELGSALGQVDFRKDQGAFFLWEGVTNYLTPEAVDATIRWIGSAAPSSEIVFTYVHRQVIDTPASFGGTERLSRTLARAGERWTFGLLPEHLQSYLAARGLDLIDDLGAADYRTRYLGRPGKGYEFYRVATARVHV